MTELEEALGLRTEGEGRWRAHADPRYEAMTGMFGGWTAALLLRSVLDDARRQGEPSALTVSYVRAVPGGTGVIVATELVRDGRAVQHWRCELLGEDERVLAEALVLCSAREPSDGFTEPSMPVAPDPDSLPEVHPPNAAGERISVRPVSGYPPFGQQDTSSCHWGREMSGRQVDAVQLAFLADSYAPRIFYRSEGPRPSVTLTMSVYIIATAEEISSVGDDYVLNEAIGTRAHARMAGQQAKLWSRGGALLATTEQLCRYE